MKSGVVIGVIIALIAAIIVISILGSDVPSSSKGTVQPGSVQPAGAGAGSTESSAHTIRMTAQGLEPADIIIKVGESITFINEDTRARWPATNVHPTHKSYPGSDIAKCGGVQASHIFDACRRMQTGESYTFTFDEAGSWRYHDHVLPRLGGTITVE